MDESLSTDRISVLAKAVYHVRNLLVQDMIRATDEKEVHMLALCFQQCDQAWASLSSTAAQYGHVERWREESVSEP